MKLADDVISADTLSASVYEWFCKSRMRHGGMGAAVLQAHVFYSAVNKGLKMLA